MPDQFLNTQKQGATDAFLEQAFAQEGVAAKLPSFAQWSYQEALKSLVIIPVVDCDGVYEPKEDALNTLRAVLQLWMEDLRTDPEISAAPIIREQNIRKVIAELMLQTYQQPSKAWSTSLPTGHQILIVDYAILFELGEEKLARLTHKQAVTNAQARGLPFNEQAMSFYNSVKQIEEH